MLEKIMANKIAPGAEKALPPSETSPWLEIMKTYVKSKSGYQPNALETAKVTHVGQEHFAYQIDLWTLMECRQIKKKQEPYCGETISAVALVNEWDYDFERPETDLKKPQKDVRNLEQTRYTTACSKCNGYGRYLCSSCNGDGGKACYHCKVRALTDAGLHKKPCSSCKDSRIMHCSSCKSTGLTDCKRCKSSGKILHWYQLVIKWYTIHSVSYQTNTPLPNKLIHKAQGKKPYVLLKDEKWTNNNSFEKFLENSFTKQHPNSPVKPEKIIEEFNEKHSKKTNKNCRIVKVHCEIQTLDITEVEYETEDFKNKNDKNMGEFSRKKNKRQY